MIFSATVPENSCRHSWNKTDVFEQVLYFDFPIVDIVVVDVARVILQYPQIRLANVVFPEPFAPTIPILLPLVDGQRQAIKDLFPTNSIRVF